ncbi:MAG: hypothetical protein ACOYM3_18900 [Terrimicrobiaceae bacterium]
MKPLAILLLLALSAAFPACSNSAVAGRQQAINSAQSNVLTNRSTRIQARDERMWAARDVW